MRQREADKQIYLGDLFRGATHQSLLADFTFATDIDLRKITLRARIISVFSLSPPLEYRLSPIINFLHRMYFVQLINHY